MPIHKTKNIVVRVTDAEYQLMQENAERLGQTLSDYVRDLVIGPSIAMKSFGFKDVSTAGTISLFSASAAAVEESLEKQYVLYGTED